MTRTKKAKPAPKHYPTWLELRDMYRGEPTRLLWAKRDTRWDVYPQDEPAQLVAYNWEGFWLPLPDGRWFKAPTSFSVMGDASTPDLRGEWVEKHVTAGVVIQKYCRAA
jgi:hypothetical protein